MELTYKEFLDLALKNYAHGGDVVYECWSEHDFDSYVEECGAITKKKAFEIFKLNDTFRREVESEIF
jgi:hypothetical protein